MYIKEKLNIYQLISLIGFILYLIAVLFGPSGPNWPQKLEDAADISMSNPVNQVVYSAIFLLALISVIPNYKNLFAWLNREKFIVFFLLWCGITIIWAIDPFVAFKRYFQYITTSLVFISVLLNYNNEKIILKSLLIVLSLYLIVSLIVVLTVPQASDPEFSAWRGLHPQKNNLGQTASLNIIFFSVMLLHSKSIKEKIVLIFFLIVALILLVGAFSMTNILLVTAFGIYYTLIKVNKIFEPLGLGKKALFILFIFVSLTLISIILFGSGLINKFFELIGKDPTLTGRTDIWYLVLSETKNNLLTGVGFQSFWIPEHLSKIILFQYWIPNQSHNGYVDIILETGIIGLLLFVIAVTSIIKKLNIKNNIMWVMFIIYALLLNISESTLIRPHHFTNVFFFMSFWVISYKFYFNTNE